MLPMKSAHPTPWRWTNQSRKPFGLNSVLDLEHHAGPKQGRPIDCWSLPTTRQDLTQSQWPEGRLSWRLKVGEVGLEPRLKPCLTVLVIIAHPKVAQLKLAAFRSWFCPKSGCWVAFWLLSVCLYSVSHCHSAGWGRYFSTQEFTL